MFVLSTTTHKRELSAGRKIENKILRLQETQKIYSPSRIEALIDSRKYGKRQTANARFLPFGGRKNMIRCLSVVSNLKTVFKDVHTVFDLWRLEMTQKTRTQCR